VSAYTGRYVLDACAVITFLSNEEGADRVIDLFDAAAQGTAEIHIHRINLLEVYYDTYKAAGFDRADSVFKKMLALPIIVDDGLDDGLLQKAGELKATNRISLADAVALALAIRFDVLLVTSDHHEFDCIEAAGNVSFLWIR
jgi:predicted nucleic acid-binding protein